jgi:hypothetical protein
MPADLARFHLTTLAEVPPGCMQVLTTAPPPSPPQARLQLTTLEEVPPDEQRCCICCCEYAAGDRMLTRACKCSPRRPRVSPQVRCRRSHAHARMQAQLPPRVHRAVAGAEDELPALQAAGARRGRHIGRSLLGKAALAEATSARDNSHLQAIHTFRRRLPTATTDDRAALD